MLLQQTVGEIMSTPVLSVTPSTTLREAVQLLSEHHISGLPVVDAGGQLIGELTEQDLMVRESGFNAGPYVMFLDSIIYLRNPLRWDRQVHQVLGNIVRDLMHNETHRCLPSLPLPQAASQLHDHGTQRLIVVDSGHPIGIITRGDVVRALASQA